MEIYYDTYKCHFLHVISYMVQHKHDTWILTLEVYRGEWGSLKVNDAQVSQVLFKKLRVSDIILDFKRV